jgi:glycerol uptake facilitator-like aquaporin
MLIFAQLVGAAIGVLIVRGGVVIKDCDIFPNIAKLCPPNFFEDLKIRSCDYTEGKQVFNMFIVETFGTFLFVSLVLNIKYHYGHSKAIINCLIVGFSL